MVAFCNHKIFSGDSVFDVNSLHLENNIHFTSSGDLI